VIPTLGRPDRLPGLVENVHEATETPHRVYLVMERDDSTSEAAARSLDTVDVFGEFGSCAAAVNGGYLASDEPLFAIANDDVRFHPGWDTAAIAKLSDTAHIIGLNDGSGDCKCFTLARRSYIEEHSGVYDKPNTVYHTYKSQCCDTEFAFYAQFRGVWDEAPDAVLEHEHWRFGKAAPDHPNYVKARESNARDLEEYNRRWAEWDPKKRMPPCVPGAAL
jgi:hypothetical protein